MVRVIVIDDEPLARQGMRQLLHQHPGINLAGESDSIAAAETLIQNVQPDALFLDIELSGTSGFDLLRKLKAPPKVVFVTAHAQHAVQAFEFDAVDYLLKPVNPKRLAEAIARLETACMQPREDQASRLGDRQNFLRIKTQSKTVIAPFNKVVALVAEGDFTHVLIDGEPKHLVYQLLGQFEALLPDPPFVRLGRSLIVNAHRIRSAAVVSRNETRIWLDGASECFVLGRPAAAKLKQLSLTRI